MLSLGQKAHRRLQRILNAGVKDDVGSEIVDGKGHREYVGGLWETVSSLRSRIATALLLMLGYLATQAVTAAEQHRVVAYLASWSVPPVIHAEKLTHLNFAFAHIDASHRAVLDSPGAGASLRNLQALKKQNPELKILLSVGGWQAEGFSDAALTDPSRQVFADSAAQLLREYSLDGVDVDWEYPGQGVAGIKYRRRAEAYRR
jgi:chitinase